MRKPTNQRVGRYIDGYTIVEVVIFLAVSGALLLSASILIGKRQDRTRYVQGVVEFEQNLQDIFNDTSSGFYPTDEKFTCRRTTYSGSGGSGFAPDIRTGVSEQGTNKDCVFIGKLIHFYPSGITKPIYNVHTVVGLKETKGLAQSEPGWTFTKVLGGFDEANPSSRNPGVAQQFEVPANIFPNSSSSGGPIQRSQLVDSSGGIKVHTLVVATDFSSASYDTAGKSSGNSSKLKLYKYNSDVNHSILFNRDVASPGNPADPNALRPVVYPVYICLRQDGIGRFATLVINDASLSIERRIDWRPPQCGG